MVLVALFFGLRPKAWLVANDARWISEPGVLRFENAGIAYVDDLLVIEELNQPGPWTIEMAATPQSSAKKGFSPLLVMHDGADRRQLAIWQWGPSLIVMNGDDYDYRQRRPRLVALDVISPKETLFLTITSGEQGTRLFLDGNIAAANGNWQLAIPVEGNPLRLVLGNSIYGKHSWAGDLHALAIFAEAISDQAVRHRFERWTARADFAAMTPDTPLLVFDFKAPAGAPSAVDTETRLIVPPYLVALKKSFFIPVWEELAWSRVVFDDMLVNTLGFIPLGVAFYGLLQCFSGLTPRQQKWGAVGLCTLLSFGIELSQAWIATRISSQMDLILNIVGAWVGVTLWGRKGRGLRDED